MQVCAAQRSEAKNSRGRDRDHRRRVDGKLTEIGDDGRDVLEELDDGRGVEVSSSPCQRDQALVMEPQGEDGGTRAGQERCDVH